MVKTADRRGVCSVAGGLLRVRFVDGDRRLPILRLTNAAWLIVKHAPPSAARVCPFGVLWFARVAIKRENRCRQPPVKDVGPLHLVQIGDLHHRAFYEATLDVKSSRSAFPDSGEAALCDLGGLEVVD